MPRVNHCDFSSSTLGSIFIDCSKASRKYQISTIAGNDYRGYCLSSYGPDISY